MPRGELVECTGAARSRSGVLEEDALLKPIGCADRACRSLLDRDQGGRAALFGSDGGMPQDAAEAGRGSAGSGAFWIWERKTEGESIDRAWTWSGAARTERGRLGRALPTPSEDSIGGAEAEKSRSGVPSPKSREERWSSRHAGLQGRSYRGKPEPRFKVGRVLLGAEREIHRMLLGAERGEGRSALGSPVTVGDGWQAPRSGLQLLGAKGEGLGRSVGDKEPTMASGTSWNRTRRAVWQWEEPVPGFSGRAVGRSVSGGCRAPLGAEHEGRQPSLEAE